MQRKSARSVRRNPIRARAFATLMSMSAARKARPALRRSKERRGENKWFRRRIPTRRAFSATSAYALRSAAPLSVPVWTYSVLQRTSYAQVIDDVAGVTLVSASTAEKSFTEYGGNKEAAKKIGQIVAERCKAKGIETVVFDRGGYVFHGRVKELADGAREGACSFNREEVKHGSV